MQRVLIVEFGKYSFVDFDRALSALEEEYGYEGFAWEIIRDSRDFELLEEFLIQDGLHAELRREKR